MAIAVYCHRLNYCARDFRIRDLNLQTTDRSKAPEASNLFASLSPAIGRLLVVRVYLVGDQWNRMDAALAKLALNAQSISLTVMVSASSPHAGSKKL